MRQKKFAVFMAIVVCLSCLQINVCFAQVNGRASVSLAWDMNADGKITLDDARAVLLMALGITTTSEFPTKRQFTLDDAHNALICALGINAEEPGQTIKPAESLEPDFTKTPEQSDIPEPTVKPTKKPQRTKHPAPTIEPWPTSDPSVTPIPPEITISEEELNQIDFVEVYKAGLERYNLEGYGEWGGHVYMTLSDGFKCADEEETKVITEYLQDRLKDVLVDFDDLNKLLEQDIVYYWSYPIWKFRESNSVIFSIYVKEVHADRIIMGVSFTRGAIDGNGYDLTLERQDGRWVVVKKEGTWVS